jgi:hypothetical protein
MKVEAKYASIGMVLIKGNNDSRGIMPVNFAKTIVVFLNYHFFIQTLLQQLCAKCVYRLLVVFLGTHLENGDHCIISADELTNPFIWIARCAFICEPKQGDCRSLNMFLRLLIICKKVFLASSYCRAYMEIQQFRLSNQQLFKFGIPFAERSLKASAICTGKAIQVNKQAWTHIKGARNMYIYSEDILFDILWPSRICITVYNCLILLWLLVLIHCGSSSS